MRRVAFFLAALVAAGARTTWAAADDDVRARFACEPADVEVGQPFDLTLELEHPAGSNAFDLVAEELALDGSWVVLSAHRAPPAAGDDPARRVTRCSWSVASLEPGDRTLAGAVSSLVTDPRVSSIDASGATVRVAGLLAEGEEEPRPLRGFPDGFGERAGFAANPWRWAALAAAVLLWAVVAVVLWRRWARRRRRPAAVEEAPLKRLEVLLATPAPTPDAVRERHFELTRLVRRAADERLHAGAAAAGLTDAEWLAALEARAPADLAADLAPLFAEAEAIKYAGVVPTSWALEEAYGRARRALERVASPGPLAPSPLEGRRAS